MSDINHLGPRYPPNRLSRAKPRRGRPSHRCLLPTKLRPEHRVEGFDCGQSALNDWLGRYALPNQQASPTTCSAGRAAPGRPAGKACPKGAAHGEDLTEADHGLPRAQSG